MQVAGRDKMLFLLGGHDLEMLTIRQVLKEQGIPFADHQLRWDNARLSSYREELEEAAGKGWVVYGVELQEDMSLPPGYKAIDHHNASSNLPCALEQVMGLFRLPLDRYLRLVVANDKAYISGMMEIGATKEEVEMIRRADRKAQGVTEQDEYLAEQALAENCMQVGDLWVVHASSPRFSPICDRLFPYVRLLVFTREEWVFYGEGANRVKALFDREEALGFLFYGGGRNGYVGLKRGIYPVGRVQEMVERIKILNWQDECL